MMDDTVEAPPPSKKLCTDLSNNGEESFFEEVEEEQGETAAQGLSKHGLDDQSFSDFLRDVADEDKQPVASTSENTALGISPQTDSTMGFLKWKKLYHQTKHDPHLKPQLECDEEHSILTTASFVGKEFSSIKTPLKESLRRHAQYSCVSGLVQQQKREDTGSENEDTTPILTLTDLEELVLLVACCRNVHQLLDLVHLLTRPAEGGFSGPTLSYAEISEIFYCLATIFREDPNDSPRTRYHLYYVLDVLERRAVMHMEVDKPDGPTASAANLTNEQMRIVNHNFQPGHTVKVIALAGTGKTTTLYHIARSNPTLQFLYCAYNKSIQQHAEKSIFAGCKNVQAKTFHSLAFPHTARPYASIGKLGSNLDALYISWKIKSNKYNKLSLASCVRDTINNYLASADEEMELVHVVSKHLTDKFPSDIVLFEAKEYWNQMKSVNPDTKKIRIVHDGYLKLYQLQKPMNLSVYDVILVDEAQDLSPAVIDILCRQDTAKVFVGDPNQQIYSFRGAKNALEQISCTHTYSLTRSFRFGPEISYACELVLSFFKPNKTQILIGTTAEDSIDGSNRTGQEAILCRMNSTLFDEVVKVLDARPEARIGFAGTAQMSDLNTKYRFDTLEDLASLKAGADVKSLKTSELKFGCKSYTDLLQKARKTGDKPMLGRLKVVNKYGSRIPSLISCIRSRVTFNVATADVVFSTAHGSKGLEFETVIVADDFTPEFEVESLIDFGDDFESPVGVRAIEVEEDERNLVYVAMSRVRKNLVISPAIWKILPKDRFLFPTASAKVCTECGKESSFLLLRPMFVLSTGTVVPQVCVCRKCSEEFS